MFLVYDLPQTQILNDTENKFTFEDKKQTFFIKVYDIFRAIESVWKGI